MVKATLTAWLIVGTALGTFGGGVHAQTPDGSPVDVLPTPLPISATVEERPPASPEDLLTTASLAQENQGTARFAAASTVVIPDRERVTQVSHGDESFRDHKVHSFDVVRHVGLGKFAGHDTTVRTEWISDPTLWAQRHDRGRWTCTKLNAGQQASAFASALGAGALTTTTFAVPALVTMNGVISWHIRETIELPGITPAGRPIQEDDYVSRSDHTLVLTRYAGEMMVPSMRNGKMVTSTIRQSGKQAFTDYGGQTTIRFPTSCRAARQ